MPLVLEEEEEPGAGPFLLCGTLVDWGLAKSTSSSHPRDGAETHRHADGQTRPRITRPLNTVFVLQWLGALI